MRPRARASGTRQRSPSGRCARAARARNRSRWCRAPRRPTAARDPRATARSAARAGTAVRGSWARTYCTRGRACRHKTTQDAPPSEESGASCDRLRERCRSLGGDDLQRDDGGDVVVQTNGRLVQTDRLDRVGDVHLALVDRAELGCGDGVGHIGRLDGTEQTALATGLDGQTNLGALELVLQSGRLIEVVDLAGLAGGLDRLDLLGASASPRDGEALGDEVVAGVPVLDLDDVTGAAEPGDLVRENQLRHVRTPQRPAPA